MLGTVGQSGTLFYKHAETGEADHMSLTKSHRLAAVATTVARSLRRDQTTGEDLFWQRVRSRKLAGKKFLRQHPIYYDMLGKTTFYVADFYCAEAGLVVEIDGEIHNFQKSQDAKRAAILEDLGLIVIRFTNEQVQNDIDRVLNRVKKHLQR